MRQIYHTEPFPHQRPQTALGCGYDALSALTFYDAEASERMLLWPRYIGTQDGVGRGGDMPAR